MPYRRRRRRKKSEQNSERDQLASLVTLLMSMSGKGRAGVLAIVVVIIGIVAAYIAPQVSTTVSQATGSSYTASGTAAQTLESLTVNDNTSTQKAYNRDYFGFRETDDDNDGCDARDEVLNRDLTNVEYSYGSSCQVWSGVLKDPYTGKTINFQRGVNTSAEVQIDHVVALNNAWESGASTWSSSQLYAYGNDMYNLLAVDGSANQEKSDASADEWLPSNTSYQCEYVARQIGVKDKYSLTVTTAEKQAMLKVLSSCPGQGIPSSSDS